MTLREIVENTLNFNNSDKIIGGVPLYMLEYFGVNHESFDGIDHNCSVGTKWTDIWGTTWCKEHDGVMGFPREAPVNSYEKLSQYIPPNAKDPLIYQSIYDKFADYKKSDDYFLGGSHRDTLWEKAYMIVGMENIMIALNENPDFAKSIFKMIMDFQIGIAHHYLKCGVEFVFMSDDLGTQQGPLISPEIVNTMLLPEYKRIFNLYKENGVKIIFHSCGNIEAFMEMFMDLGVDVLNPVQATANNLERIRDIAFGKMSLQGGISSAVVMAGPISRIYEEVKEKIDLFKGQGGYFCSIDQGMPFPDEHLKAFFKALDIYG